VKLFLFAFLLKMHPQQHRELNMKILVFNPETHTAAPFIEGNSNHLVMVKIGKHTTHHHALLLLLCVPISDVIQGKISNASTMFTKNLTNG
jgi:hypothetical protein